MNYLAHAYLSFGDPAVLTGNMISDFVKGRKKFDYPERILAGIHLHRAIDDFTDTHPSTRKAADIFREAYGKYSGAFVDVVYDHFLAVKLARQPDGRFEKFCAEVYQTIQQHEPTLPPAFQSIFPYMKMHNWLFNYQFGWGIEKSLQGLVHRAAYLRDSKPAYQLLQSNYRELQASFDMFFPELKEFSLRKFSDIH